jgi:hypothetical protein
LCLFFGFDRGELPIEVLFLTGVKRLERVLIKPILKKI